MNTRNKIFNAALSQMAQRGYDAVSIRDIVKEVGIKESSFYNHFSSKQELLDDIFRMFVEEANLRIPNEQEVDLMVKHQPVNEIVQRRLVEYIRFWDHQLLENAWYVINMEQFKRKEAMQVALKIWNQVFELLEMIFTKLVALKKIKKVNPATLAYSYGYAMRAIQIEYELSKSNQLSTDEITSRMQHFAIQFANSLEKEKKWRFVMD